MHLTTPLLQRFSAHLLVKPSLLLAIGLLAACGSEVHQSSSQGVAEQITSSVSAVIQKGPVNGAQCSLFTKGNIRVAGPILSQQGKVDFGQIQPMTKGQPLYVQCQGGIYLDEATGQFQTLSSPLRGALSISETESTLVVTPLSELAFRKSKSDLSDFATQTNNIASALGLSDTKDMMSIIPTDVNTQLAANDTAGQYGALLATLAQFQSDNQMSLDATLARLEQTISANKIDPTTGSALQKSADNLRLSAQAPANPQLDGAVLESLRNNISQRSGALPPVSIDSIELPDDPNAPDNQGSTSDTPQIARSIIVQVNGSFTQGGQGPSVLHVNGLGFYPGIPVSLAGQACKAKGTSSVVWTRLRDIDCSNVTLPSDKTTTTLKIGISSKTVTLVPAPNATWSPWSLSNNVSLYVGGSPRLNRVVIATPQKCNSPIVYTLQTTPANGVARINPITGEVTPLAIVGSGTVTAATTGTKGVCGPSQTTYSFIVSSLDPNTASAFTAGNALQKTYGDAPFSNTVSCAATNAPTYTSEGAGVTVNPTTGQVTLTGTTTINSPAVITATCPAVRNYAQSSNSYSLQVNPAPTNLTFATLAVNAAVGTQYTQTATLGGFKNNDSAVTVGGTISYRHCTGSNSNNATINPSSGSVTLNAAGAVKVEAHYSGSALYNSSTSACYTINAQQTTPTLTFSQSATTLNAGGSEAALATLGGLLPADTQATVLAAGGRISYSSSHPNIASVDANSATITALTAGTATITASFSGTAAYSSVSARLSVTVNPAGPVVSAVAPASIQKSSRQIFTLTGSDLTTNVTAQFNGLACASAQLMSATEITIDCPVPTTLGSFTLVAKNGNNVLIQQSIVVTASPVIAQVDAAQVLSSAINSTYQVLAPGRSALIRAYVYSETSGLAAPTVTVKSGANSAINMTCPNPLPTTPPTGVIHLYSKSATCFATLPAAQVKAGMTLEVALSTGQKTTLTPNVARKADLQIVVVPIHFTHTDGSVKKPKMPVLSDLESTIKSRMPLANVTLTERAALSVTGTYGNNLVTGPLSSNSSYPNGFSSLLSQLGTARKNDAAWDKVYLGMVPYTSGSAYSTQGIAYHSAGTISHFPYAALSLDANVPGFSRTVIHEIGHNLSLSHAPCGGPSSTDAFWTTNPWPNADAASLGPAALYDYTNNKILDPLQVKHNISPNSTLVGKEIMSYCGGTWFSEYSYKKIADFMSKTGIDVSPEPALQQSQNLLAQNKSTASLPTIEVRGTIEGNQLSLDPIQLVNSRRISANEGDYVLRLTTTSGQQIYHSFYSTVVEDLASPVAHFSVSLPSPGPLAKIEVLKDNVVVYQSPAKISEPTALSLSKTAANASVQKLTFLEQASYLNVNWDHATTPWLQLTHIATNGQRTTLATNATGGKLKIPIGSLPAGGKWEVSLSDGLNTRLEQIAR